MELTVQIPDDLARRMSASGGDLSRRALEALAIEEFKSGHITKPELRRLLGFGTRYRLDGFLKSHNVYEDYTMEDFEQDRDALKQLRF
jgi:predicted HTH domain antitoxin